MTINLEPMFMKIIMRPSNSLFSLMLSNIL
jgi:hypothetical protein